MNKIPRQLWIAIIALILLKLWLVEAQHLYAITYSDDVVYLRHARSLLNGEWLGSYDNLTLATGPFYATFIALAFLSGLRLLLAEQLIYIAACVLLMIALLPLFKKSIQPLVIFTLLLFNPLSYELSALRAIRDFFYASLTLLIIACALGLLVRMEQASWKLRWWAVALGVSLAAFWLTREEGIWIFPTLGLIVASAGIKIWHEKSPDWKSKIALWAIALALPLVTTLIVSGINGLNYGVFAKTEFDSKIFLSAYGSLTRVKSGSSIPYVPVSRKMRMNIYDISPAFSELRPYLEGDIGKGWAMNGRKTRENRDEILGAWFMWAFRDSVREAGYYSSGKFPADFYKRMSSEIDTACENHWLVCYPKRSSMMPPWQSNYFKPLAKNIYQSLLFVTKFQGLNLDCPLSSGSEANSAIFLDLTRDKICGSNSQTVIWGWIAYSDEPVDLTIKGAVGGGQISLSNGKQNPENDPGQSFSQKSDVAEPVRMRFDIVGSCPFGCSLEVSQGNEPLASYPFSRLTANQVVEGEQYQLFIEDSAVLPLLPEQRKVDMIKIHLLDGIKNLYQSINLPLIMVAMALYIYMSAILWTEKRGLDLWVVETILLVGLVSRIFLIALIHTTSFKAIWPGYLAPGYPLMLSFMGIAIIVGLNEIMRRHKEEPNQIQAMK